MKTLETERLILRKFKKDDFAAVHSYASDPENVTYMIWGPNSEKETRDFISLAIIDAEEKPCTFYVFAAVLKKTDRLVGSCNITVAAEGDEGEVGWILHRDYWKQGLGTEMGNALLEFGFQDLGLHRVLAHCSTENYGSYRVMENIGMRREGTFIESRRRAPSDKEYGDEYSYAILADEWETKKEITDYRSLPVVFDGFIDVPELTDGVIHLVNTNKTPGDDTKKWVPGYKFIICKGSETIGDIDLRIGYPDSLYYGGQIGYNVDEKHRGNGYAGRACRLVAPVAKAHGMVKLYITNNQTNTASMRVCEKLGARLLRVARLPEWHDLYKEGRRFSNIFVWDLSDLAPVVDSPGPVIP
ncbi:MAG: GNAT family N-acetyltransferase [Clostridiales bacterium]|nr:GNAT family N-acetyltransferase [Clostridiales bacterium]